LSSSVYNMKAQVIVSLLLVGVCAANLLAGPHHHHHHHHKLGRRGKDSFRPAPSSYLPPADDYIDNENIEETGQDYHENDYNDEQSSYRSDVGENQSFKKDQNTGSTNNRLKFGQRIPENQIQFDSFQQNHDRLEADQGYGAPGQQDTGSRGHSSGNNQERQFQPNSRHQTGNQDRQLAADDGYEGQQETGQRRQFGGNNQGRQSGRGSYQNGGQDKQSSADEGYGAPGQQASQFGQDQEPAQSDQFGNNEVTNFFAGNQESRHPVDEDYGAPGHEEQETVESGQFDGINNRGLQNEHKDRQILSLSRYGPTGQEANGHNQFGRGHIEQSGNQNRQLAADDGYKGQQETGQRRQFGGNNRGRQSGIGSSRQNGSQDRQSSADEGYGAPGQQASQFGFGSTQQTGDQNRLVSAEPGYGGPSEQAAVSQFGGSSQRRSGSSNQQLAAQEGYGAPVQEANGQRGHFGGNNSGRQFGREEQNADQIRRVSTEESYGAPEAEGRGGFENTQGRRGPSQPSGIRDRQFSFDEGFGAPGQREQSSGTNNGRQSGFAVHEQSLGDFASKFDYENTLICPGGTVETCIAVCPGNTAPIYGGCVAGCADRCGGGTGAAAGAGAGAAAGQLGRPDQTRRTLQSRYG